jgi:hypothetical protein
MTKVLDIGYLVFQFAYPFVDLRSELPEQLSFSLIRSCRAFNPQKDADLTATASYLTSGALNCAVIQAKNNKFRDCGALQTGAADMVHTNGCFASEDVASHSCFAVVDFVSIFDPAFRTAVRYV